MPPQGLNLGSGFFQIIDGWENLDYMPHHIQWMLFYYIKRVLRPLRLYKNPNWPDQIRFVNSVKNHDITRGLPYQDAIFDYIYASHFLEHFTLQQGRRILKECSRSLKPGGILRLVVPDLDWFVKAYLENNSEQLNELKRQYSDFSTVTDNAELLNHIFYVAGHHFIYNAAKLEDILCQLNFIDVHRETWANSKIPGIGNFELKRVENLYIEAVRA